MKILGTMRWHYYINANRIQASDHILISLVRNFLFDSFLFSLPGIVNLTLNGKRPALGVFIPFLAFAGSTPAFNHNVWKIIMIHSCPHREEFADKVFGFSSHTDKECGRWEFSKDKEKENEIRGVTGAKREVTGYKKQVTGYGVNRKRSRGKNRIDRIRVIMIFLLL